MKFKNFLFLAILPFLAKGQTDSTQKPFQFSAYGELYYGYDFSEPADHLRPGYVYNHKRHNELNANLILLQGSYQKEQVRANLGLMAGNYTQYNMSAEPTWAQSIYEANVGVRLSEKHDIWLDAGIFSSHYGFESLLQTDSWTLTRGMYVENVPYYISGVAVSKMNKKKTLYLGAILLNGWQHIQKPDGYQKPSLGLQAKYMPNEKLTLNYSNFLGSDKPDSQNSFRHFHNIYAQYLATDKVSLVAETNFGFEKSDIQKAANWLSLVSIIRYKFSAKKYVAFRTEYYQDKDNIMIATPNGFSTFSCSSNFDYWIQEGVLFRIEAKYYKSKQLIFDNNSKDNNTTLTASLSVKL